MNEKLIKKLKFARTKKRLTQQDVATILNLKSNTISNYENGVSEPDIDTFCSMCKIYDIDIARLLGDIYGFKLTSYDLTITRKEMERIIEYRSLKKSSQEHMDYELKRELEYNQLIKEKNTLINEARTSAQKFRNIPLLSEIRYSPSDYKFKQLPINTIPVPINEISLQADFILKITNSIMEPTYCDSDLVYVKKTSELEIGDIGVFLEENPSDSKDDTFFIREYQGRDLVPHNKQYRTLLHNEFTKIIGKILKKID